MLQFQYTPRVVLLSYLVSFPNSILSLFPPKSQELCYRKIRRAPLRSARSSRAPLRRCELETPSPWLRARKIHSAAARSSHRWRWSDCAHAPPLQTPTATASACVGLIVGAIRVEPEAAVHGEGQEEGCKGGRELAFPAPGGGCAGPCEVDCVSHPLGKES